jgi:zinc transport system permease protein
MNFDLVFDPLFLRPFFIGLIFAAVLPLLGCYLRLREEWLAALALAQMAAAGALLSLLTAIPLMAGGLVGALVAVMLKNAYEGGQRKRQGAAYALLLLIGWGVSVLLVSNLPLADRVGHALFDGQLYFTEVFHLVAALVCAALVFSVMWRLSPRLLAAHFFPDFFRSRGGSARRIALVFDGLVAVSLALATMSIGVMSAFALIFVPPWLAWRHAQSWRGSLLWATGIGILAHVLAFFGALLLDQPFGPLLALVLAVVGLGEALWQRLQDAG